MTLHQPPVIAAIAVDELAGIKASIASLQEREKALVAALKATGMERVVGARFTKRSSACPNAKPLTSRQCQPNSKHLICG